MGTDIRGRFAYGGFQAPAGSQKFLGPLLLEQKARFKVYQSGQTVVLVVKQKVDDKVRIWNRAENGSDSSAVDDSMRCFRENIAEV